jgi:polyhydroxybutyrate depolymerase
MINRMKTIWLLAGILVWAGALSAAEFQRREWAVDSVTREARVYFPKNAEKPPLVFAFHGHGGSSAQAARGFRIHEVWPEAAVVYMQGLPTVGRLTDPEGKRNGWNAKVDDPGNRDLKFFDAVYASLKDQVDTNRVYCAGHSNGGSFAYYLWAVRGNLFAAVAPSGALSRDALPKMKPKPVLHIAGETDPLVKYAWQNAMIGAVRKLNGCSETGGPWAPSGDLTGTLYPSATGTPLVTLIHPGGHTYPKEAPELIARFFKAHVLK